MNLPTIIPVTTLRRNFGRISARLAENDPIVLTKSGEPFAILKATPEVKNKYLKKAAGSWKATALDDDKLWKEVAKKKSRRKPILL